MSKPERTPRKLKLLSETSIRRQRTLGKRRTALSKEERITLVNEASKAAKKAASEAQSAADDADKVGAKAAESARQAAKKAEEASGIGDDCVAAAEEARNKVKDVDDIIRKVKKEAENAAHAADDATKHIALTKDTGNAAKHLASKAKAAAENTEKVGVNAADSARQAAADATNAAHKADAATVDTEAAVKAVETADSHLTTAANIAKEFADAARNVEKATKNAISTSAEKIKYAQGAADSARNAASDARNAIAKKATAEKPIALPPCDATMLGGASPAFPISQLKGVTTASIVTLGLTDVFLESGSVTEKNSGNSLDYLLSRRLAPQQPIAHFNIGGDGILSFRWDERAKDEREQTNLLCFIAPSVSPSTVLQEFIKESSQNKKRGVTPSFVFHTDYLRRLIHLGYDDTKKMHSELETFFIPAKNDVRSDKAAFAQAA